MAISGIVSRSAKSTIQAVPERAPVISYRPSKFLVISCNASIRPRLNSASQFAFKAFRLARVHPATPTNPGAHSFTIELQTNGFSREFLLRGLLICIEHNGKADCQHDRDHNGDAKAAHGASTLGRKSSGHTNCRSRSFEMQIEKILGWDWRRFNPGTMATANRAVDTARSRHQRSP
jgi:hypothetical protein